MKGQMSFLIKALFIVIASVLFVSVILYFGLFKVTTTQEKGQSNLKMEAENTLQKLVNDGNCLAFVNNNTPQKGVIDISKLNSFVSSYGDIEPECAKALDFDYNIRVVQYAKNFTIYPGKTCRQQETMSDFLCTTYNQGGKFIYVACNYHPAQCEGVCQACGEFDNGAYNCHADWGCGDDPLKNCPYTGSCDVTGCPAGKPPDHICCIYRLCPTSACEQVITGSASDDPLCFVAYEGTRKCDLSQCTDASSMGFCAHCTRGVITICVPSHDLINITIPMQTLGFGVGFGTSGFSPEKAKATETQASLPITIRYNETFAPEGIVYIYAVKGELESLSSQIEDVCEKAAANGKIIDFTIAFHISLPVTYSNGKLCMGNSCKVIQCKYPVSFENIDNEGDYPITFSFDPAQGKVSVTK